MNQKSLTWVSLIIGSSIGYLIVYFVAQYYEGQQPEGRLPNIVLFYVDDLGYGDLSSYGAKGVETPNIDYLAQNGVRFTDAHCSAATCTPSRYALLTGRYAFRNQAAVLPGDAPLIIDPTISTLPKMLQNAGYHTAVIGKWHLGLGRGEVNWNEPISPGPAEVGFDYDFLMPATGDRVPTVYMEEGKVLNVSLDDPIEISYREKIGERPTGLSHPESLRVAADTQHSRTIINGVSRIGYMAGGKSAEWVDEEFPDIFTGKAIDYIEKYRNQPFFLYFSFHDIHVPRLPNPRFVGKSQMGPRGDAIVQVDWMTGEIVSKLRELGLEENTLIIFTSDNGPVLNDGYEDEAEEKLGDHQPAGPFRGGKYSAFEAGTRVPTIIYWKGEVEAGESDALWSQVDLFASIAELVNQPLGENDGIDSRNVLSAILGTAEKARDILVEESFTLSLRSANWKYIRPVKGDVPNWIARKRIEGGGSNKAQLYDLSQDIGEKRNLAEENPAKVMEMEATLKNIEARTNAMRTSEQL